MKNFALVRQEAGSTTFIVQQEQVCMPLPQCFIFKLFYWIKYLKEGIDIAWGYLQLVPIGSWHKIQKVVAIKIG